MKKSEFDEKYTQICLSTIENFMNDENLKEELKTYLDENGKFTHEQLSIFVFTKSIELSMKCNKKVLEELIEFDD